MIFRRNRFADVISRQLDLFEREYPGVIFASPYVKQLGVVIAVMHRRAKHISALRGRLPQGSPLRM